MVLQERVLRVKGYDIVQYTLANRNGIEVSFLNYGGVIARIVAPDKFGKFENIVLSHENMEDYFSNEPYYGGYKMSWEKSVKVWKKEYFDRALQMDANNQGVIIHSKLRI